MKILLNKTLGYRWKLWDTYEKLEKISIYFIFMVELKFTELLKCEYNIAYLYSTVDLLIL